MSEPGDAPTSPALVNPWQEESTMVERTCVVCGVGYTAQRVSSKYCSPLCVSRAQEARRPSRVGRTWPRTCTHCGQAFRRSNCASYCSETCRDDAHLERRWAGRSTPIPWAECAWCGKAFIASDGRRRFCSKRCLNFTHPHRSRQSPIEYGDCQRCGACFVRRAGRVGAFCSENCAKRTRNSNRRHLERSSARTGDRITLQGLGDRDGWRCHICKRTVTQKPGNLPASPSVDHLLPLSAGGSHTWQNVALAHRQCNGLRGAGGAAQLRLIA